MNLNTELIDHTEALMPPTVKEQTVIAEIAAPEGTLSTAREGKQGRISMLVSGG